VRLHSKKTARMPAEWEPHEATWLAWPHNYQDWPGRFASIRWVYIEIVRLLHRHEKVCIVVEDEKREMTVRRQLDQSNVDLTSVDFFRFSTDRSWVRDSGPTFVSSGTHLSAVCWCFNAWARYSNWQRDSRVSRKIARSAGVIMREPEHHGQPVVLEGGAIDVNGLGALLTTEGCLLEGDRPRNRGMTREDYEQLFAEQLNIQKVLWLSQGIAGDDTGGHIDGIARFVGSRTVVIAVEANRSDANYVPLKENLVKLRTLTDQNDQSIRIVELPMPRPLFFDGYRLPASYANFYIANGIVLVPTFNDPNDRLALKTLEALFPSREVCGIHAVDLAWGFGTIHCVTQQQPSICNM